MDCSQEIQQCLLQLDQVEDLQLPYLMVAAQLAVAAAAVVRVLYA